MSRTEDRTGGDLREGYAEVGDVRLHYVEAGDGPLIVLLHGFPEFWFSWRLQIAPLALPRLSRIGYVRGAADRVPEALAGVDIGSIEEVLDQRPFLVDLSSKAAENRYGGIFAGDLLLFLLERAKLVVEPAGAVGVIR